MRTWNIDPDHWLYKAYRSVKRVQLLGSRWLNDESWFASLTKEIEASMTEDGEHDFCPVLRTVFLLGPGFVLLAATIVAEICLLPVVVYSMTTQGTVANWQSFGHYLAQYGWMFAAAFVVLYGTATIVIEHGPKLLPKRSVPSLEEWTEPSERDAAPVSDERSATPAELPRRTADFPIATAWAVSKKHGFCMLMRTTRTVAA